MNELYTKIILVVGTVASVMVLSFYYYAIYPKVDYKLNGLGELQLIDGHWWDHWIGKFGIIIICFSAQKGLDYYRNWNDNSTHMRARNLFINELRADYESTFATKQPSEIDSFLVVGKSCAIRLHDDSRTRIELRSLQITIGIISIVASFYGIAKRYQVCVLVVNLLSILYGAKHSFFNKKRQKIWNKK